MDDDMPALEDNVEPEPQPAVAKSAPAAERPYAGLADDDDDEDDEEEMEERTLSLFGAEAFESAAACVQHMKEKHGFDIAALQREWGLDVYGSIKLVNYMRSQHEALAGGYTKLEGGTLSLQKAGGEVAATLAKDSELFAEPAEGAPPSAYLQSPLEDDPLLMCVSPEDEDWDEEEEDGGALAVGEDMQVKVAAGMTKSLYSELEALARDSGGDAAAAAADAEDDEDLQDAAKTVEKQDNYYFDSYTNLEIHETMLKDVPRTTGYRDAMMANAAQFKDAVVLDVGCGTGILSIFAARAGAKKVYAIDACKIAKTARKIVADNGLSHIITVIQGKVEDVELPGISADDLKQVDIIVSEWMGYFLLFESMFASVIVARDRWLKPGGALYPGLCHMYMAPLSDEGLFKRKVEYWDDVYGVDMRAIRPWALKSNFADGMVDPVHEDHLMDAGSKIYSFDCHTANDIEMHKFSATFSYKSVFDGPLTGFTSWFDTLFSAGTEFESVLTTSPLSKLTHWQQTTFYLDEPVPCALHEVISGEIKVHRNLENSRMLIVVISFQVGEGETVKGRCGTKKWKF